MRREIMKRIAVTMASLLGALAASVPATVLAHSSYNIAGYGTGVAGSVGNDGTPANPGTWTNGNPVSGEYTGGLPAHWYAGVHNTTANATIQTGAPLASPPNNSLLQQTNTYNGANDPDYPTDRVLAVGGLSWADPGNDGQGWGHGLDFGLIHTSPIDTLVANGPIKMTITVTDDPSDGVAPRLAFALYGGWDTNPGSSRHQTFVTSPAPVNNPLGSSGLTLLDYQVASGAGRTLSRTYIVDATYAGEYTLVVGALGGTAGQYQVTVTLSPNTGEDPACAANLAECEADLGTCEEDLASAAADADGDGVGDATDACAATPAATDVDALGCSRAEFCATFDVATKIGLKSCKKADWENDEPLISKKTADCVLNKAAGTCDATTIP